MSTITTADSLPQDIIDSFRRDGFVKVPSVLTQDEVKEFHAAALALNQRLESHHQGNVFTQLVNVWVQDEVMRRLTLHPRLAAIAEKLAGVELRLWHDHILTKQPRRSAPTEFHQDQPYWPHANSSHPLSAWIALVDVPVDRGCMSFLPGSHRWTDLSAQNLRDARSLFALRPEAEWQPRVTVPLRAGDCTFHHGRCAHRAGPNLTDKPRVAHVVIYMDATTTYDGKRHVVTDPLNPEVGSLLEGELFPTVNSIVNGARS